MGLLTYKAKFGDKEISIKAKKEVAQRFASSLKDLFRIHSYTRELTGIIGVTEGWNKESSHVMMTLGLPSGHALPDQEGYAKDLEVFTAQVPASPAVIEGERLKELWQRSVDLLNKHMPIEDNRKTPEQHAENVAKSNRINQEREADNKKREAKEAEEAEEVRKLYPHLATIKASGKSSHACGSANLKAELDRAFPGVAFSVKSKSFSGGDDLNVTWTDGPTSKQVNEISGKYQEGNFDGMEDIYNYNHDAFPRIFGGAKYVFENRKESADLMVEAAASLGEDFTHENWKEFEQTAHQFPQTLELLRQIRNEAAKIAKMPSSGPAQAQAPVSDGNVTVRMNPELNGVEILFSAKPDPGVIAGLKAHGFRWSPKGKLWYAKQSDSRISFAHSLQKQEVAA